MKNRFDNIVPLILISGFIFCCPLNGDTKEGQKKQSGKNDLQDLKNITDKIMNQLTPEEKKKLRALQQTSPKEFYQEIKSLAKKYRNENLKKNQVVKDLVAKYRHAENEQDKEKIKAELTDFVRKQFNIKMEANRKNYERAHKRLLELKEKLEKREAQADNIINDKVQQLIKNPVLSW